MGKTLVQKLVAEFTGTFLLVFAVGCNTVSTASGTWAALSIASTLMVSIYALGPVSGGHFNPAVSLAIFLSDEAKDFTAPDLGAYAITQLVAGAVAGACSYALHGEAANLTPNTAAGYTIWGAAAAEIAYTFMLCFVVLRGAVMTGCKGEYFALAIGFVIVAGGYAAGGISGGAFNPAVALGVDVGSAGQGVYYCFFYWLFEAIGAILAAVSVKYVLKKPQGETEYSMGQKLISEFLGTFFLVFTVVLNVGGGSPAGALSIGASLMCMIYALADVSGAAFNPAVAAVCLLCGFEKSVATFAMYTAAEIAGGLTAAICATTLTGKPVPLAPGGEHTLMSVGVAEIIATFVLCFVVVTCACNMSTKYEHVYGLAIGFVIMAMGNSIGAVSGGSLNPAVSVGLDGSNFLMGGGSLFNCLPYSIAEFCGAGLAAGLFTQITHSDEYGKQGLLGGKIEKPDYGTA